VSGYFLVTFWLKIEAAKSFFLPTNIPCAFYHKQ